MHAGVDPYAVLGAARGADDAAIHAAYRDAVRRTHPDAGGSAAAFEAVQEAYEVLRDPARRRTFDAIQRTLDQRLEERALVLDHQNLLKVRGELLDETFVKGEGHRHLH